jgi:long-chain fatty acid transport protein
MPSRSRLLASGWFCFSLGVWLASTLPARAQGLVLPSVGPINRSMGGAAVAAPLDATGALYWNPATISGLPCSEMDFGAELLYTQTKVASQVGPGAFGPGVPAGPLFGATDSETGVYALPTFGLSWRPEGSDLTLGMGVFTIGGFGVNYPAVPSNPVLSPPPPNGFGLGAIYSELVILELAPAASYQLTERLSIGGGPTVTMAKLTADPAPFAPPDDANGDGFATYPSGQNSRFHWGGGFQLGAYYAVGNGWAFGSSLRSPQWFETFRYHAVDEIGRPRTLRLRLDYPMIVSIGAAYSGFERLLVALDVRYVDYNNTKGFGAARFDAAGAVTGLGWHSVPVVATGIQYMLTEFLSARVGYTYNPSPIPGGVSALNIASPPIYEHIFAVGASYSLTDALTLSVAYVHAFPHSITGPLLTPAGPVSGTAVTNEVRFDALTIGVSLTF